MSERGGMARPARAWFWGPALAWGVVAALSAALAPPNGQDWARLLAIDDHGLGGAVLAPAARLDLGEALATLLVGSRAAFVLLAPVALVALLVALARHALAPPLAPGGAEARAAWWLTLGLTWLALPAPGVTFFTRTGVGVQLIGAAALAWWLVPLRGGAPGGLARGAALALTAVPVALCARVPATLALAWLVVARLGERRRGERPPGPLLALGGLAAGVALAWLVAPPAAAGRMDVLFQAARFTRKAADAVAIGLFAGLALALRAAFAGAPGPTGLPAPGAAGPAARRALWACLLALLVGLAGLGQAHLGAPALLAPLAPVIVAVTMVLAPRLADRRAWTWLVALSLAVQVVAAVRSLTVNAALRADVAARRAAVAAASGEVAAVPAFTTAPGAWFAGEDLGTVARRAAFAAHAGVVTVEVVPAPPGYERTPPFSLVAGGAGGLPLPSRDLALARARVLAWLRAHPGAEVRLVVAGLDFPARRGRPLLAGRSEGGRWIAPAAAAAPPDRMLRAAFRPAPGVRARWPEAYVIHDGAEVPVTLDGERVVYAPARYGHHALVLCDARECLLAATIDVRP